MKSLIILASNKVVRLSDDEAANLVTAGKAKYTSKCVWKKSLKPVKVASKEGLTKLSE